jgi:hypothetical protein
MFENADSLVQQHTSMGSIIAGIIVLVIVWVIVMMIRGFWCWFWKTSAIANELESVNTNLREMHSVDLECREVLKKANSLLERIAESTATNGGNRRNESGGNRAA